jgi:hypothetical protein
MSRSSRITDNATEATITQLMQWQVYTAQQNIQQDESTSQSALERSKTTSLQNRRSGGAHTPIRANWRSSSYCQPAPSFARRLLLVRAGTLNEQLAVAVKLQNINSRGIGRRAQRVPGVRRQAQRSQTVQSATTHAEKLSSNWRTQPTRSERDGSNENTSSARIQASCAYPNLLNIARAWRPDTRTEDTH